MPIRSNTTDTGCSPPRHRGIDIAAVAVDHAPVASESKQPLVNPDGMVTVVIVFVPEIATSGVVGPMVVADAMVATDAVCSAVLLVGWAISSSTVAVAPEPVPETRPINLVSSRTSDPVHHRRSPISKCWAEWLG
jgi:hypothetical protein